MSEHDLGLDLRKFSRMSPLEQLDRLESDFRAVSGYEKGMRAADADLKATTATEVIK